MMPVAHLHISTQNCSHLYGWQIVDLIQTNDRTVAFHIRSAKGCCIIGTRTPVLISLVLRQKEVSAIVMNLLLKKICCLNVL